VSTQTTDADPGTLASSDDGQFLYATISGDFAVQRFTLPSVAPDIKWTVGTDPTFGVSYTPTDVKVEPGVPHTVAVIRTKTFPGDGGVAIYDDSAQRPNIACSIGDVCSSLQWKADGSAIYVEDAGSSTRYFYALAVSSAGTTLSGQYGGAFRGFRNTSSLGSLDELRLFRSRRGCKRGQRASGRELPGRPVPHLLCRFSNDDSRGLQPSSRLFLDPSQGCRRSKKF
jgi:hypothetical protein